MATTTPVKPLTATVWQHPAVATADRLPRSIGRQLDMQRIGWNGLALAGMYSLLNSSWIGLATVWLEAIGVDPKLCVSFGYILILFFVINIASAIWQVLYVPPPNAALHALSPKQKKLLGLVTPEQAQQQQQQQQGTTAASSPTSKPTQAVSLMSPPSMAKATASFYSTPPPKDRQLAISPMQSIAPPFSSLPNKPTITPASMSRSNFFASGSPSTPSRARSNFASPQDTAVNYDISEYERWAQDQRIAINKTPTHEVTANMLSPSFGTGFATTSFGKYQPASPIPQQAITSTPHQKESSALQNQLADELLNQLGIAQVIDDWSENLREWIVGHVFIPVVERMETVDSELEKNNLGHLRCRQATWETAAMVAPAQTMLMGRAPNTLAELLQAFPQVPVVQERLKLEKYLMVPKTISARDYVVDRIKVLTSGSKLMHYRWNSGGNYKDKEWTEELPADAQIVCHLICCFFDERVPSENNPVGGFSSTFFVPVDADITTSLAPVKIRQITMKPPHVNVVIENKTTWHVRQGRNNLFHAVILFLYYVRQECSGFIGPLDLGGRSIGLLQEVFRL